MLSLLFPEQMPLLAFLGTLFAFAMTCCMINACNHLLPIDQGRQFAHNGDKSKGKPKGAGIIFILVYVASVLLFAPISVEIIVYLVLVTIEMLTGYFDDASEVPWGRLKKGLLDLVVSLGVAFTYLNHNGNEIMIASLHKTVTIPTAIFVVLIVILVWASINVTNCADGVDGLSGTLTIITLMTVYVIITKVGAASGENIKFPILLFVVCILGYLWYNATPSRLMMGDAGSRAMGIFIAIAVLKMGCPFLYVLVAAMLMVDGGLGLVKVSLIKLFHIHIFKNTMMPLHDHVRKSKGWSNEQTVFRFAIIQVVISVATVYLISL